MTFPAPHTWWGGGPTAAPKKIVPDVAASSKSAKAEESVMAGTVSKWKSLLQHVASVVTFGLAEFQKYAPSALVLAQTLFPEYAGAEKAIQQRLVNVTGLIQNSIVTVEAKYASATASNETNSAKLADVLALAGPEAVDTLQAAGVTGGLDRVTAIVNAGVAVLHAMPAPAGT